jgi:hypothetical protein
MQDPDRRPVHFIGISQTGLTPDMVHRIARAIRTLPVQNHYNYLPTTLKMQKVSKGRLTFILFHTDMEVSQMPLDPGALAELRKACLGRNVVVHDTPPHLLGIVNHGAAP